jgi:hypothetical protein
MSELSLENVKLLDPEPIPLYDSLELDDNVEGTRVVMGSADLHSYSMQSDAETDSDEKSFTTNVSIGVLEWLLTVAH